MGAAFAVAGLFTGPVVVLAAPVDAAAIAELGAEEAKLVAGAVDKRRAEFATVRRLSRTVLAQLGHPGFEVLHDERRAPIWPAGIAGSLSHSRSLAIAAVGERALVGTVGVDVEDPRDFGENLWRVVFTDPEKDFLRAAKADQRGPLALLMFSAKEALYKAQYPHTGLFMDFADARIELPDARVPSGAGRFVGEFKRTVGCFPSGTRVEGRFQPIGPAGSRVTAVQFFP